MRRGSERVAGVLNQTGAAGKPFAREFSCRAVENQTRPLPSGGWQGIVPAATAMKHTIIRLTAASFLGLLCSQCGERQASPGAAASAPDQAVFDGFFTDTPPASPAQIHAVRDHAQPGETITLTGLVMGRAKPFVEGAAAFILCDTTIIQPKSADECADGKLPWNPCCSDPAEVARATATIQLSGPDGRVIKQGLKGIHGLTELSEVTLTGTVDRASTPQAFVINATSLHVRPPGGES